jgi:hypothetical protein
MYDQKNLISKAWNRTENAFDKNVTDQQDIYFKVQKKMLQDWNILKYKS